MRVALVSPTYDPHIGGVERHVQMIAREMHDLGVHVEVICTDPSRSLPPTAMIDNILVRRFGALGSNGYFFSPALQTWMLRHVRDYDLVHAHSYHTPVALFAILAAKARGIPYLFTPHYHGTGHSRLQRLLHIPYYPIGRFMVRGARRCICVSDAERALVHEHFGADVPIAVIPNGIDTRSIEAAEPFAFPDARKLVLAVGRLEKYKNYDALIEAVPCLPAHYDVVIVGEGSHRAELEALAARLGVGDRVQFKGRVSQEDLGSWYRTAHVFVTMSRHEAFGLTLLEAAAGGCQVIASDIPAHREAAGPLTAHEVLFAALDGAPRALAEQIERGAASAGRYTLGVGKALSWAGIAEQTLLIYQSVVLRHD